jgi:Ca2+-binding EF-hand superfamily protein
MVDHVMQTMDYDCSGAINYKEFLSATLDASQHLSDKNLIFLFNYLDPYKKGCLSK